MLSGNADAGMTSIPQKVHRGLHAGLIISAPSPYARTSASPTRNKAPDLSSWLAFRRTSQPKLPEREKEGWKQGTWQSVEEYNLDDTSMASISSLYEAGTSSSPKYQVSQHSNLVKGIRAVNIMDTLSQLAGSEALASTPPQHKMRYKVLPATPASPPINSNPSRIKSRGRTPDWIKRIFDYAKRGQLEQLRTSLKDMEATLVRNLSDHHGNNLLHILACQGYESALAWLCSSLMGAQSQLEGALADENRSGLTPVACAVKYGHSNCVEWLVTNTKMREKLSSKDGERCLLHIAAKYNQVSVLQWLVNAMKVREIDLDQRDHCGDTPLHLASRAGGLETCRILLSNGSNVSSKNDLGLKASDIAMAAGHAPVQHYLNLFESSLCMAGEMSQMKSTVDSLREENGALKGYFKDVLSIGKRLAKERDEMCRDTFGKLQKIAGLAVHEKVASVLTELMEENKILRERLKVPSSHSPAADLAKSYLQQSGSMSGVKSSDLISGQWKGLLVSGLADMEHRLLIAEEGWRKLSSQPTLEQTTITSDRKPLDNLMYHIEQLEGQQKLLANASFTFGSEARSLSSSESSLDTLLSLPTSSDNIYSQLLDRKTPPRVNNQHKPPPPPTSRRESRDELKRRLQQMVLTSESGNASVLEVIEPTTSESEEERADKSRMPFLATSSPRLKALSMSLEDELEKIQEPRREPRSAHRRRCLSVQNLLDTEEIEVRIPDNQPDLLIGTVSMDETGDEDILSDQHTSTPTRSHKKRTFLQKITMKAGWSTSKRKAGFYKSAQKVHEITPDDFKETYMSRSINTDSPVHSLSPSQHESGEETTSLRVRSSGSSSSNELHCQKSDKTSLKRQTPLEIKREVSEQVEKELTQLPAEPVPETEPSAQEEPPPPIPPSSPPSTRRLVKKALADIKSGHLQHHIESMSVTTSEDSGFVARPSSSASKSDSLLSSRPDSSSSSLFKGFTMRLVATELASVNGRISPAPSDFSKADSTRMLGKIEEIGLCKDESETALTGRYQKEKKNAPRVPIEKEKNVKEAKIISEKSATEQSSKKRSERAWYDLSDEEPDLLTSATMLSTARSSSDEEVNA
ncbi:uncharacterized protein LOC132196871 [Neocloeon triangulifer]|uniref:uncharacterized protein LOC132196871 n=1 Tax=Neocloeon triangulifer TaxID=2078957 RepID=UPI00286EC7B7|nr:uncharacterized protein LOC132196871 [Neocloeon triangulifer]